jgi:ectoine hydroxylase
MKLTAAQHEQFDREGYLFFPGLFTREETSTLTSACRALCPREAYNVREKGNGRRSGRTPRAPLQ